MHVLSPLAQSSGGSGGGVFVGAFFIIWVLVALAVFVFWLWMLIDILGSSMPSTEKILWALVVFFLPLIGSLIYFFMRRGSARSP